MNLFNDLSQETIPSTKNGADNYLSYHVLVHDSKSFLNAIVPVNCQNWVCHYYSHELDPTGFFFPRRHLKENVAGNAYYFADMLDKYI